jgi:hypothetical protein
MPVKSPAATPTKTRKTRTRKTSTKTARVNKVIKEVQAVLDTPKTKPAVKKVTVTTFKSGKVVKKETVLKRPSTARLISPQKYLKDISTRWAIHNYEIQELIKDFTKGFEAVKPYHAQLVELVTK